VTISFSKNVFHHIVGK